MDLDLEGRCALITGASAGIGRGIARRLALEGVRVAVAARRRSRLEELATELVTAGAPEPMVIPGDLVDPTTAPALAGRVLEAFGGLDILVNSAGGSRPIPLDADEGEWTEAYELNFRAVRRVTHSVLDAMVASSWGRIVNITGTSEPSGFSAAGPAKAGVHAWSKALSRQVGRAGVTVNSVAPGRITSEQIVEKLYPDPAERERFARENIPLGYFGDPDDVANLVTFLCSPRAGYITGELIHVDGGLRRFAY